MIISEKSSYPFTLLKLNSWLISKNKNAHNLAFNIDYDSHNHEGDLLGQKVPLECITPASPSPYIRYLGILFDSDLNFKAHLKNLSSKLSHLLFPLNALKNFLPKPALKTFYYTLFHCHINYATEIWSSVPSSLLIKS